MNLLSLIVFGLLLPWSNGFQVVNVRPQTSLRSPLYMSAQSSTKTNKVSSLFRNVRFDTIRASGLKNVQTAGGAPFMLGINSAKKLVKKAKTLPQDVQNMTWDDVKPKEIVKKLHGPKFYLLVNFLWARKFPVVTKNMFFWLWTAFCIKWYRARYVFKIPVWDRQPNWNNIITSKEQEKDLKAFTCKNCGSTLFIAKTREFFFEGDTGIGGLGCFACGAKGKDNFVMDRDRIVEDVADIDDYFEYERPLDFISAADRRKVLKETGGDEDAANALLIERENAKASEESQAAADAVVNGSTGTMEADADDAAMTEDETVPEPIEVEEEPEAEEETEEEIDEPIEEKEIPASSGTGTKAVTKPKKPAPPTEDVDLDFLDMDDF